MRAAKRSTVSRWPNSSTVLGERSELIAITPRPSILICMQSRSTASIAAVAVVIFAWFAILFTGRYPRGLFDFVLGVLRWENRVAAYAFVLVTDRYPPFRLSP